VLVEEAVQVMAEHTAQEERAVEATRLTILELVETQTPAEAVEPLEFKILLPQVALVVQEL
jgi:hypothetical protein